MVPMYENKQAEEEKKEENAKLGQIVRGNQESIQLSGAYNTRQTS